MPSVSKSQQRLFGLVHKCQKTGECISPKIKEIANNISKKDAKDFAKTKHKNLPNKVKRKKKKSKRFSEWLSNNHPEFNEVAGALTTALLAAGAVAKTAYDRSRGIRNYSNRGDESTGGSYQKTYKYVDIFLKENWNWSEIIRKEIVQFYYYYPDNEKTLKDNEFIFITLLDSKNNNIKNNLSLENRDTKKQIKDININYKIGSLKNRKNWDDYKIDKFYKSIQRLGQKPEDFGGKDVRLAKT